jgi:signal transduction histidine kinase/ActR/RegA family two-component response regulator
MRPLQLPSLFSKLAALWRAGALPDRDGLFTRPNILVFYLVAAGLTSLSFYVVHPGYYDPNANLVASILVLAMIPLAWHPRWYVPVVHVSTLVNLSLVTYIAIQTGGVNSTAVVWLNVVALPVLLLIGPRAAMFWIAIVLTTISALYVGMSLAWVNSQNLSHTKVLPWAWMNQVLAMANLMLGIRLHDHLHDQQLQQLQQRNQEIKATHQALLQTQAHKDNFVAAVGHELRTPMNAILGFNGLLREELAGQPEHVAVVDHIRRSTDHLLQVVNDILDFSQLQAGKMPLYPVDFDLAALAEEALTAQRAKATEKGLGLSAQIDPALPRRVHADRQRLLQILRNLLGNAIKFTERGEVSLRITAQGERLRWEVSDSGCGIAPQRQAHIFRRFEHADVQTTRTYGGTGLGLSICEKLVHLQGGQIGVKSQEGQGAQFWFHTPLQAAVHADPEPVLVPAHAVQQGLRILVVDDNAINLMVARLQLEKCWPQAQVVTADSAAAALNLLAESVFDVALVDMVMPEMDGMQLTQAIRQRFAHQAAHMPIIALTANTNPVDRQRCLDAGMCDVLSKPMDMAALVHSVSTQVQSAKRAAA